MNYYIFENGQQLGPFTIEQLKSRGITSETSVWCEGMPQWTTAKNVPELASLLHNSSTSYHYNQPPQQFCPDNNLVISIVATIMTLFCCFPFAIGFVALIYSLNVESKFKRGDIDGAYRYAKSAKSWAIWSIVASIAVPIILALIYLIFGAVLFSTVAFL